jgi:hypothetical protein
MPGYYAAACSFGPVHAEELGLAQAVSSFLAALATT